MPPETAGQGNAACWATVSFLGVRAGAGSALGMGLMVSLHPHERCCVSG
ncbi:hypothetical protein [Vreelandella nigrificans]|nr:hypothetical protein [Halomonas nigrificans]